MNQRGKLLNSQKEYINEITRHRDRFPSNFALSKAYLSSCLSFGSLVMTLLSQQGQSNKSISVRCKAMEESGAGFPIEPRRGSKTGFSHSNSMIHPNANGYTRTKKEKNVGGGMAGSMSSRHDRAMNRQTSHNSSAMAGSTNNEIMLRKEATVCYIKY